VIARLAASIVLAAAIVVLAAGAGARAQAGDCPAPPYPGDAAPREAIAQWMAYGASLAALPRELPVMAALVESGLTNLQSPDIDSAGYFQMRVGVWSGAYPGFPQNPDLQLKWFADQATQVRRNRIAAGAPDPTLVESDWGAWIADVEHPAEHLRGRYQLRLGEARALIGAACSPPPLPGAGVQIGAVAPLQADTTAPAARLDGDARQRALHRGALVVAVGCQDEPCTAGAIATLRLPRAQRPPQVASKARAIPAGAIRTLRIALRGVVRARVRKALRARRTVAATVRVLVVDAAGNASARTRTVRITG
jgi:hypothetical protein